MMDLQARVANHQEQIQKENEFRKKNKYLNELKYSIEENKRRKNEDRNRELSHDRE